MTVSILIGDVREQLATLPDNSIDLCVTSPPYWGLRDYDCDGQIGMESTLGEHLAIMVEVFEHVRRVLKPTGSCFLNYGDCYATSPNGRSASAIKADGTDDRTFRDKPMSTIGGGIKPKDLCMIPNRLAIALQDAGWWVRSEIVWGKTNPMPDSSGSQRPSVSHEKIFWLAKSDDGDVWRARDTGELSFGPDLSERCALVTDPDRTGVRWLKIGTYYDANAVALVTADSSEARLAQDVSAQTGSTRANAGRKTNGNMKAVRASALAPRHAGHISHTGLDGVERGSRYLRSYEPAALDVWRMSTESFRDAHFATFPTELARRAIVAGCPPGGTVLDPFFGAGTTGLVADRLQRDCIGIELNPSYVEIARARLNTDRPGFLDAMEAA